MRHLFLLSMIALAVTACLNDEILTPEEQLARDIQIIEEYISEKGIPATATSSGLHYFISEDSSGTESPTLSRTVVVKYQGYLTNGFVFDKTPDDTTRSFKLVNLIPGWQEGLQQFTKGDKGQLFLPSYLGYGSNPPNEDIPKNAVLIFDIELVDF